MFSEKLRLTGKTAVITGASQGIGEGMQLPLQSLVQILSCITTAAKRMLKNLRLI